jgi:hypothetical protein
MFLGLRAFTGKILSLFFNFCARKDVKSGKIWSMGRIMVEQSIDAYRSGDVGFQGVIKSHNFPSTNLKRL